MKNIKDVIMEMITIETNELVAISKQENYIANDLLTSEYYNDTERQRKELNLKIEILAHAIGAFDYIYYVHNNSIEFKFKFDDFTRRELVSISNLENYISRF